MATTLAPLLKKEDGALDWTMSARARQRIRGVAPSPGPYLLRADRWTISRSIILDEATSSRSRSNHCALQRCRNSIKLDAGRGSWRSANSNRPMGAETSGPMPGRASASDRHAFEPLVFFVAQPRHYPVMPARKLNCEQPIFLLIRTSHLRLGRWPSCCGRYFSAPIEKHRGPDGSRSNTNGLGST